MLDRTDPLADLIAVVPARGGSKGLAGKNTRLLAGEPLYRRAIRQGMAHASRCLVTTDIGEILSGPRDPGCQYIVRPAELAADDAAMDPVLVHAFMSAGIHSGMAVLLQPTSPLRNDDDIRRAIMLFRSGGFDLVLSVCETDVGILKYGTLEASRFVPVSKSEYCFVNRQMLPPVFRPNGAVYVFDIARFLACGTLASDRIGAITMPLSRSIDIDVQADLDEAERQFAQHSVMGSPTREA